MKCRCSGLLRSVAMTGIALSMSCSLIITYFAAAQTPVTPTVSILPWNATPTSGSLMSSFKPNATMPANIPSSSRVLINVMVTVSSVILLFLPVVLLVIFLYCKRKKVNQTIKSCYWWRERENGMEQDRAVKLEDLTSPSYQVSTLKPMPYPSCLLNMNVPKATSETSTVLVNKLCADPEPLLTGDHKLYCGSHKREFSGTSIASSSSAYPPSSDEFSQSQPHDQDTILRNNEEPGCCSPKGYSKQNKSSRTYNSKKVGRWEGIDSSSSPETYAASKTRTKLRRKSHTNDGLRIDSHTSGYFSNTSSDTAFEHNKLVTAMQFHQNPRFIQDPENKLTATSPQQLPPHHKRSHMQQSIWNQDISSPPRDPLNSDPSNIPSTITSSECMSKKPSFSPFPDITWLINEPVTSAGLKKKGYDFSLEIPQGAVPEGYGSIVDVGVALFGQFHFPDGMRPVSPMFWVCVREQENLHFSKPVIVTISHFLDLKSKDDIKSLGLTFLKADHKKNTDGMYEFQPTEGEMDFKPSVNYGVLKTTHFCSLCIACMDKRECLTMTQFCITSVLPRYARLDSNKQNAFFFITFYNLNTCLAKVDEVIRRKKLETYEKHRSKFHFKGFKNDPTVEIVLHHHPIHGKIGFIGNTKISRSEVDFFVRRTTSAADLRVAEHRDFYPPRFCIFLASSPKDPTLTGASIKFKGVLGNPKYDIYLDLPPSTVTSAAPNVPIPQKYCLGIYNLQAVRSQLMSVTVKWREIGLNLGLTNNQLDIIHTNYNSDATKCLTGMLKEWLNRAYDTAKYGEPSWQKLSGAVGARAGGNNPALANDILHLQVV